MPTPDEDLLARLNALKKSHISLDTNLSAPSPANPESQPRTKEDNLTARFLRLGGGLKLADATSKFSIPQSDLDYNEEDDKTLEELLNDLGPRNQWDIGKEDEKSVGELIKETRGALQRTLPNDVEIESKIVSDPNGSTQRDVQNKFDTIDVNYDVATDDGGDDDSNDAKHEKQDKQDEHDADEIVARVLAEVELEKKYNPPTTLETEKEGEKTSEESSQSHNQPRTSDLKDGTLTPSLELPEAPTSAPVAPKMEDDLDRQIAFEDALTARMAALSLPSVPSFQPDKTISKKKNAPKYTDDDIDSWCIICQDDATVKCLGCEGDLYCRKCWREGHIGPDAGFEEKRHKWAIYNRQKP